MSNSFGPPPEGGYGPPSGGGFGPYQGPPEPPAPPGPPGPPPPGEPPPYGPSFPPGPPAPGGGPNNGLIAAICITLSVIVVAVVFFGVLDGGDGNDSAGKNPGPGSSDTAGTTPSTGDGSSGGIQDDPGDVATSPSPDLTEEAFKAVANGSCLPVWDTGHGGTSEWRWSHEQPPDPVSCKSEDALVQVTGTSGGCPTSDNNGVWTYQSPSSGRTTQLCLRRIYHVGGCFLAVQENNRIVDMGTMTAVDCRAKKVPIAYNQIMHITGVYNTSKGTDPSLCRRVQGDQTEYWSWTLDDGETLLCTMVYRG